MAYMYKCVCGLSMCFVNPLVNSKGNTPDQIKAWPSQHRRMRSAAIRHPDQNHHQNYQVLDAKSQFLNEEIYVYDKWIINLGIFSMDIIPKTQHCLEWRREIFLLRKPPVTVGFETRIIIALHLGQIRYWDLRHRLTPFAPGKDIWTFICCHRHNVCWIISLIGDLISGARP